MTYNLFTLEDESLYPDAPFEVHSFPLSFYNYFLLLLEIREDIPWSPGGCRSLYGTQDGGMIKSLMTPSTTHPQLEDARRCVPEVPCVLGPSSHCDQIGVISYTVHAVP